MSIPLFPMHIPLCCLVLLLSSHFVRCCSNDFPFQTHPSCTRTDLAWCAKWWPVQMANHRKTMGLWGLSLVFRSFPFKSQELVKVFYLVLPCSGIRNLEPKSSGVHLWYFMIFLVVQLPYRPEVCKAWLIPIRQWSRTSSGGNALAALSQNSW